MDENTLNDLLECSVCLERLDTSSKVLPCQHTFCRKCLEVIVASHQELRCPECRVLVSVKIDELPPNVLLMRILGGLKTATYAAKNQEEHEQNKPAGEHHEQKQQNTQLIHTPQQQQPQNVVLKPQSQIQAHQQQQSQHSNNSITTTQRRCQLPHAFALYDFNSSESSDLHFKKGDLILLKRKIDVNWYIGQKNGIEGTFPSNYVQVMVPLPSPQCIALYDFKMGANEEEGCLNFKKGALIHVLRRVDDNWAEGRIGNMIGIFPIAFVELNNLAKHLLANVDEIISKISSNTVKPSTSQQTSNPSGNDQQQTRNIPPVPLIDPTTSPLSSSLLSNTTCASDTIASNNRLTTNSASNSNASSPNLNSNSMPNSPQQSQSTTPQHYAHGSGSVRYRNGKKRHSLNALLISGNNATSALGVLQTNRHSAEILSIPSEELLIDDQSHELPTNVAVPQTTASQGQQRNSTSLQSGSVASTRANVLKHGHANIPPTLPWGYLALYPYKPHKSDELELKKGCVYIVTERLNGWFKGKNWQDVSGFFPGNYVTPLRARDQQQLMHQWKFVPQPQSLPTSMPTSTTTTTILAPPNNENKKQITTTIPKHHTPPDLPPRHAITTTTCASVWTKPLSHTVEAFFNRTSSSNKTLTMNQNESNNNEKSKEKESKSKDSSSTSAALSLMKRLTHIKSRAKSPASTTRNAMPTTTSPNNLTENIENSQGSAQQLAPIQPVHVRSGSCPSQLLQNYPHEPATGQSKKEDRLQNAQQQLMKSSQMHPTIIHHGSERIKGHKERPRIQATRQSMDGTLRNSIYNNIASDTTVMPYNIPNSLVLNPKCGQQFQQLQQQIGNISLNNPTQDTYGTHHRKSQSLDANNTVLSATNAHGLTPAFHPPIQSSSIAAAITASATTKSVHSGRESRFRCIVPYPPNSDVELELHVGDIIYVQRKQKNGWYKGTHARTQKTGLFPASFVEPDL